MVMMVVLLLRSVMHFNNWSKPLLLMINPSGSKASLKSRLKDLQNSEKGKLLSKKMWSIPFYDGDDNSNVKCLRDILLTYSFYNFDLGYCQGMSDLLSPILYVMEDEPESFWCFVALMERLGPNFNRDQNGVHSQLFAVSKYNTPAVQKCETEPWSDDA